MAKSTIGSAPITVYDTREQEVPSADFNNGVNAGGSNCPGIGIGIDQGAVVGTPEQFTLLDQRGAARTPQVSQVIGGVGLTTAAEYPSSGGSSDLADAVPIDVASPADNSGDGSFFVSGGAALPTLAGGWVEQV